MPRHRARWAEGVKVLLSITADSFAPSAHSASILRIRRRPPSPRRLAEAREIARRTPDASAAEWVFSKETALLDAFLEFEPAVDVEVQAIQTGPAVCVSHPAEYFVEYGLRIKRERPFSLTHRRD